MLLSGQVPQELPLDGIARSDGNAKMAGVFAASDAGQSQIAGLLGKSAVFFRLAIRQQYEEKM
jgi:hypothetical protein